MLEFPASVARFCKLNVPVSGGGYLRLYPLKWTMRFLRRINHNLGEPFLIYVHPWEIDPEQPRLGSAWKAWRHYVNLSTTGPKLERLLSKFRFGRMADALHEYFVARMPAPRIRYAPTHSSISESA